LKVNESACELNEAFVKMIVLLAALTKPEFLENIMSFVEELFVKTLKITEIVGIEGLALQGLDHLGDPSAFLAHCGSIRRSGVRG
jgi:hypothetical protein